MSARIYRKIENNMQRGKRNSHGWILEHEVPHAWRPDPLTGWAGSGHPDGQIRLNFPTLDAAIDYAEREGLPYHVVPAPERRLILRSYAENFR